MATPSLSRRDMLKSASCGFGYLALAGLATEAARAETLRADTARLAEYANPLAARPGHFPVKAKRVIFLFMQGGPSHLDTFDYKPALAANDGKTVTLTARTQNDKASGKLLASPFKFKRSGQSGLPISEVFPHLSQHADDMCLINSMYTNSPAHPQATIEMHTGTSLFVRPSVGAWMLYGLGTVNQNLPGFITINAPDRLGGAQNFGSSFLPASYQGTRIGASGKGGTGGGDLLGQIIKSKSDSASQRKQLDLLQEMNRELLQRSPANPELEGVIESYELAFRMQSAVPQVLDISSEPEKVREMYGIGKGATSNFGTQCLMARRLAEAGVRYIELHLGGWDQHNGLKARITANAAAIDQPIAALLADLKQRGMLEETLVVWGGEFGRTAQGQSTDGRNHNAAGFTCWMAGGGVKGGMRYGETDEFGSYAAVNKVHTHDLHATLLHIMGLDHQRLTYKYGGRDFRLTDVYGKVVKDIMA
ncbi:MAG: DUF1501 domain-containing protein [Phycisphaeraceae bacterium]